MRQPRAVVIARGREEDLRLVLQPAERLAVNHAVAVALKSGPDRILGLGPQPALGRSLFAACGARICARGF